MAVTMVFVVDVIVVMLHRLVPVRVAVRLSRRVVGGVFVLVVFVVDVIVVMLHRLVPTGSKTRPRKPFACSTRRGCGLSC